MTDRAAASLHRRAVSLNNHANVSPTDPMPTPIHPLIATIAASAVDSRNPPAFPTSPTTDDQDRLLQEILSRRGPGGLLLAGRQLDAVRDDPLVICLLNSDSPWVLLDKVARLNRYFHASHRHRVLDSGDRHVRLEHVAITGPAPTPAQSLFVCGLYLVLLESVGCRNLTAAFDAGEARFEVAYQHGAAVELPDLRADIWHVAWETHEPQRVLPGLDDILLTLTPEDLEATSTAAQVTAMLSADLGRSWKVDDLAGALHLSPRSLQRRLRDEETSFSKLLSELRLDEAKRLLRSTSTSIGDIGYTTGFADTAHFSRTFRHAVGTTPTDWRAGRS